MSDAATYLVIGADTSAEALAARLEAGGVACVELRAPASAGDAVAAIDRLRPVAQSRDVAFLLAGAAPLAARTGCDGVRIDGADAYAEARRICGKDAIVGVAVGGSRHAAMEAGEAGADFIAFDPDPELVAWWAELMEIPAVAAVDPADFRIERLAQPDAAA